MEFTWTVAANGYEVVEGPGVKDQHPAGPPLVGRFLSGRDWGWRSRPHPRPPNRLYNLSGDEYRVLPRRFAGLVDADEDRCVAFANEYGLLGDAQCHYIERTPGTGRYNRMAEPLEVWSREAAAMACAIGLWDSCKTGETGEIWYWVGQSLSHYEICYPRAGPDIDYARRAESFHADPVMHLSGARRAELERDGDKCSSPNLDAMSAAYERHNHPRLFYLAAGKLMRLVNYKLTPRVGPRLYWSPDASGLEGHNSPIDLLGAMWYLLFDSICKNAHHKRCFVCGNPYEASMLASRNDRLYCSDACRMKQYRQRKKSRRSK